MATLAQHLPSAMTVGDFLEWPGDGSRRKYQLVDGQLRAMAPASPTHGTIQATIARLLGNHLSGNDCRVVTEPGIVPRVHAAMNMRVPGLAVSCIPDQPGQRSLPDPILIIEILSPATRPKLARMSGPAPRSHP